MHHPRPARPVQERAVAVQDDALLERCVRAAQHGLAEVPQAVLDVVHVSRAVRDDADADDVQTVQLVHHRDLERAVVRADLAEAVRVEHRPPFGVVVQAPAFGGVLPDHADARHFNGKLVRVVVLEPRWGNTSERDAMK